MSLSINSGLKDGSYISTAIQIYNDVLAQSDIPGIAADIGVSVEAQEGGPTVEAARQGTLLSWDGEFLSSSLKETENIQELITIALALHYQRSGEERLACAGSSCLMSAKTGETKNYKVSVSSTCL